jgi:hypothetical protein
MKRISIDIHESDILDNFSAREIVKLYGANALLASMMMNEIVGAYDKDQLLDAIGEDAIRDYLSSTKVSA